MNTARYRKYSFETTHWPQHHGVYWVRLNYSANLQTMSNWDTFWDNAKLKRGINSSLLSQAKLPEREAFGKHFETYEKIDCCEWIFDVQQYVYIKVELYLFRYLGHHHAKFKCMVQKVEYRNLHWKFLICRERGKLNLIRYCDVSKIGLVNVSKTNRCIVRYAYMCGKLIIVSFSLWCHDHFATHVERPILDFLLCILLFYFKLI